MIYLDNIIFSLQKTGGISVVWENLIDRLLQSNSDIRFIEYPASENNIFRKLLSIPKSKIIYKRYFNAAFSQLVSPKITSSKPFIFHSSYFRTCNNPKAINITTVHDFIYEQGTPNFQQRLRIKLDYRTIRKSDAIVCISESTKKDLLKYLPDVDKDRVSVIYNGVSNDYHTTNDKIASLKGYVLYVGSRSGYKNFGFIVSSLKDSDYKLVICGNELTDSELGLLEATLGRDRYKFFLRPSNEDLNKIYNSVHCLVYPSSYEGFGIPILEAQRAGCPVIALNSSSIPEVMGHCWGMMDNLNKSEFIRMLAMLEDSEFRNKVIVEGLVNSKRFSWDKMAGEYIALYNSMLRLASYHK